MVKSIGGTFFDEGVQQFNLPAATSCTTSTTTAAKWDATSRHTYKMQNLKKTSSKHVAARQYRIKDKAIKEKKMYTKSHGCWILAAIEDALSLFCACNVFFFHIRVEFVYFFFWISSF